MHWVTSAVYGAIGLVLLYIWGRYMTIEFTLVNVKRNLSLWFTISLTKEWVLDRLKLVCDRQHLCESLINTFGGGTLHLRGPRGCIITLSEQLKPVFKCFKIAHDNWQDITIHQKSNYNLGVIVDPNCDVTPIPQRQQHWNTILVPSTTNPYFHVGNTDWNQPITAPWNTEIMDR